MKREELIKNKGYWISKIQIGLYNQLENYMSENSINRTKLAKKLGVSKGYITQVLNGDFNHRISKLVELSLAINKIPEINFKNVDQLIKEENDGYKTVTWDVKVKKQDFENIVLNGHSEQIAEKASFNLKTNFDESVVNYS
jgi:transcriptional regulator with XRE-family HTH domain